MIPKTVRKRVIYHGRVQGVGFRATVYEISKQFEVNGFVRNCSDGTVELMVDADPQVVDHFLAAIAERFSRSVTRVDETEGPRGEDFTSFEIRR